MEQPGRHVLYLAKKIGPRMAGSDGEAAAASYVLHVMSEAGVEVDMETFSSWKSEFMGLAVACLAGLTGFFLFPVNRTACFVIVVLAFVAFEMETWTWPVTSRFQPRSSSSNVLGRVHAGGDMHNRVVIVANYDTCRSSPLGGRFLVRLYRGIFILVFVSMLVLTALGFFGIFANLAKVSRSSLNIVWYIISPFAAVVLVFTMLIAWGEIFGRRSPGANDNAAGVGVMLAVLTDFAENPPEHTEVWGVATARGFAGGRGMVSLLKRHGRQMSESLIINVDHPGVGNMRMFRTEGVFLGFKSSRRLRRVALRASKKADVKLEKGRCRTKKSDAMVALARFRPALTIGSLKGTSYKGWRSRDDRYEDVDRDALDDAFKLVRQMVRVIDSKGGRSS